METSNTGILLFTQILMYILISIPVAVTCYLLAKEKKGTNVMMWIVLGILPIVNFFFALPYLIGTRNMVLEAKIQRLLQILEK